MKDNVIDKVIACELQKFEFVQRRNIKAMTKDLNSVYASFFTKGNKEKAKEILQGDRFIVSNRDLFIVSFFGGGSVFIIIFNFLFMLLDESSSQIDSDIALNAVKAFSPVSRILFFIIYIIVATGFVI